MAKRLEVRALGRLFQRCQLLPQRQVLQDQLLMAAERQRQRAPDHDEKFQHASIVASVGLKITGDEFWRRSGGCFPWAFTIIVDRLPIAAMIVLIYFGRCVGIVCWA